MELSDTIKYLKDIGVVIPTTLSLFMYLVQMQNKVIENDFRSL